MITREFWANHVDRLGSSQTERKRKLLSSYKAPLKRPHSRELKNARIPRKVISFRSWKTP
jgi:hypothetical protein